MAPNTKSAEEKQSVRSERNRRYCRKAQLNLKGAGVLAELVEEVRKVARRVQKRTAGMTAEDRDALGEMTKESEGAQGSPVKSLSAQTRKQVSSL